MPRRIHHVAALLAVAVAAALLGPGGPSAQAFTTARVVKAEPYVSFDRVAPGSSFRLAVALRISDGWHINAHKPTFDYLIATDLEFAAADTVDAGASKAFALAEPIYPA
ncbi:MAG TPA: hypothetical protein VFE84_10520, partial [Patescibacteria group bacterium]|nr:hypothetical protein [Patescibacteria group bacterium]